MAKKNQKLLMHVIENAFDFLETAIEEFNEKPKYSILHFSTAVELFLKARLIHEH
jgi:HEPN domain-containing protein